MKTSSIRGLGSVENDDAHGVACGVEGVEDRLKVDGIPRYVSRVPEPYVHRHQIVAPIELKPVASVIEHPDTSSPLSL